jgi:hypothetical protein
MDFTEHTSAELFKHPHDTKNWNALVSEYNDPRIFDAQKHALLSEYWKAIERDRSDVAIFLCEFEAKMLEREHNRVIALNVLRRKFMKLATYIICFRANHHGYLTLKYWLENNFVSANLRMTKGLMFERSVTLLDRAIRSSQPNPHQNIIADRSSILEVVKLLIQYNTKGDGTLKLDAGDCISIHYTDEVSRAISRMLFEAGLYLTRLHYPFWPDPKVGELVEVYECHAIGYGTFQIMRAVNSELGQLRLQLVNPWDDLKDKTVSRRFLRVYKPPPTLMQQCKRVICDNILSDHCRCLPLELQEFINSEDGYVPMFELVEMNVHPYQIYTFE